MGLYLRDYICGIISVGWYLWHNICGIIFVGLCLWDCICGIISVGLNFWDYFCGIIFVGLDLWDYFCGIIFVRLYLWDYICGILFYSFIFHWHRINFMSHRSSKYHWHLKTIFPCIFFLLQCIQWLEIWIHWMKTKCFERENNCACCLLSREHFLMKL